MRKEDEESLGSFQSIEKNYKILKSFKKYKNKLMDYIQPKYEEGR